MKFLANENFPYASKNLLFETGNDIIHIGEFNHGISDKVVMEMAIKEQRTILTFDKDYGELIYKYGYKPPQDVVFFKWSSFEPNFPAIFLQELIFKNEISFEAIYTVIGEKVIMQRKY